MCPIQNILQGKRTILIILVKIVCVNEENYVLIIILYAICCIYKITKINV